MLKVKEPRLRRKFHETLPLLLWHSPPENTYNDMLAWDKVDQMLRELLLSPRYHWSVGSRASKLVLSLGLARHPSMLLYPSYSCWLSPTMEQLKKMWEVHLAVLIWEDSTQPYLLWMYLSSIPGLQRIKTMAQQLSAHYAFLYTSSHLLHSSNCQSNIVSSEHVLV